MERRTLPKQELAFMSWSAGFISAVEQDAERLGITTTVRDEAIAVYAACRAAFDAAANPAERTRVLVEKKRIELTAWRRMAGRLTTGIRSHPGIDDAILTSLGIPPRARNATIGAPVGPPTLVVTEVRGRTVHLRVGDGQGPARPAGVAGFVLFSHVGEDQPTSQDQFRYEGASSRLTVCVTFASSWPIGQRVWFAAEWLSPTLESGPLSTAFSARLADGVAAHPVGMRRAA